jgi:hypothetical protein
MRRAHSAPSMLHVTCCGAAHLNRHPADLSKSNVRFCVLSWFVLVTAISLVPLPAKIFLHTVGRWHDCDHLFVFFVTGALVLFGAPRVSSRAQRTMSILAFCAALEGHSGFRLSQPLRVARSLDRLPRHLLFLGRHDSGGSAVVRFKTRSAPHPGATADLYEHTP